MFITYYNINFVIVKVDGQVKFNFLNVRLLPCEIVINECIMLMNIKVTRLGEKATVPQIWQYFLAVNTVQVCNEGLGESLNLEARMKW